MKIKKGFDMAASVAQCCLLLGDFTVAVIKLTAEKDVYKKRAIHYRFGIKVLKRVSRMPVMDDAERAEVKRQLINEMPEVL